MSRALASAAVFPLLLFGGCGGGDEGDPVATTTAEPPAQERAQQVRDLPRGWKVERNRAQGFAVGRPPGWRQGGDCIGGKASGPVGVTLMCSPDRLVSLSISADRTGDAFEIQPDEFAVRALEGLAADSYEGLEAGEAKPFHARYDAAKVEGSGRALASDVRQHVTVVVLRRDGFANFTAVIAANARKPTEPAVRLAERALRTLRSQPVGAPSG